MIQYKTYKLDNGLELIVLPDNNAQLAIVNLLYKVGAKNENPEKTGFAHLFEHLMFEGSKNISDFDKILQNAGGENNAFTNNDYTNYYITISPDNIDTAFCLEADRMNELAFSEQKFNIQKGVVIEEYKQRYINQAYGDTSLLIRDLSYEQHPYKWSTIGKSISHIEQATLNDAEDFFYSHYAPNNAIMVVAGNVNPEEIAEKVEYWFGAIPTREIKRNTITYDKPQISYKEKTVYRDVPFSTFYRAYKMVDRYHINYYAYDLISDILSNGKSSWFEQELINKKNIFNEVDAYILGSEHPGLFIINAKPKKETDFPNCENEIDKLLKKLTEKEITEEELSKVKNRVNVKIQLDLTNTLEIAIKAAYLASLNMLDLLNTESSIYNQVTINQLAEVSKSLFVKENLSTLYYFKNKK